jgi:hypothetical protein
METYKELTEQAHVVPQLQRGWPSAPVRACANESLPPRAAGAARPYKKTPQVNPSSAVLAHTVLLNTTRLVDQALEYPPHCIGIQRLGSLTTQAFEHLSFAFGIVHGEVVFTLELTDGEHDLHAVGDELQDTTIQVVDASP